MKPRPDPTVFNALPPLSPEEHAKLRSILLEFSGVFSDKPTKTTSVCTILNTQPIRSALYRLHSQKWEFLCKELHVAYRDGTEV